jgi:Flp pilus assembly protein TadD
MKPRTIQQQLDDALAHHRAGRLHQAEVGYRQILAQQPNYTDALHLLGSLGAQIGQNNASIQLLQKAIQLNPNIAAYHGNLGAVYMKAKRLRDAEAALKRAIQLNPNTPDVYYNLGCTLVALDDVPGAFAALKKGLELQPGLPELHTGMGVALRKSMKYQEAIAAFRRSVALRPDYADAHWNLGLMLLLTGNLSAGWAEYEWRTKMPDIVAPRNFPPPQWAGEKLYGKTILLHAEQGFGDTIQFIRFVPDVIARGGRVIVECPPELANTLRGIAGIQEIFVQGQRISRFDTHCSIMSLPLALNVTSKSLRADVPYLAVPPDRVAHWQSRLDTSTLNVGLVWAGRPEHPDDLQRSMRLADFAPLAAVPSVRFYMLQKGPAAAQASSPPPGLNLINWTAELHDFVDTAALVSNLDLIVGVDTSVVHLAGALARPVWVLLPLVPDWRWMLNRFDSPWYPTMRLFRQTTFGDWTTPLAQLTEAIHQLTTGRSQ